MSVYYKFRSESNAQISYVDFDGLHISVSDLKKAILHQKRLGKTADFDLLVSFLSSDHSNRFSPAFAAFSSPHRYRMLKRRRNTKMITV